MPSRTISRAPARSCETIWPPRSFGRPPTTSTRQCAPSVERLVDGAPVVVERGAAAFAVGRRKHAAAAVARHGQAGVADAPRRVVEAGRGDLVAPRRDAADAVPRAGLDDVGQRPLRAHGRGVDREPAMVGREVAHGDAMAPRRSSARRRRARASSVPHARDRELRVARAAPAASARRNSSARCDERLRALCWPPTIVKCDWWPLSQARNTTPVL